MEFTDCQIIHPDVYHRKYEVGKTVVRVEGYDLAGNKHGCHRTVTRCFLASSPSEIAENAISKEMAAASISPGKTLC